LAVEATWRRKVMSVRPHPDVAFAGSKSSSVRRRLLDVNVRQDIVAAKELLRWVKGAMSASG